MMMVILLLEEAKSASALDGGDWSGALHPLAFARHKLIFGKVHLTVVGGRQRTMDGERA